MQNFIKIYKFFVKKSLIFCYFYKVFKLNPYKLLNFMELIKKWTENYTEAGCDEVGRGCLCGPVAVSYTHLDVYKRQSFKSIKS